MAVSTQRAGKVLAIADEAGVPLASDGFIGGFVSLGALIRKFVPNLGNRQLVVAVTAPRRDYIAALVAAGWMVSAPPPTLDPPIQVFRDTEPGSYLRAVTEQTIVTGVFTCLNEARKPSRVITGGRNQAVDSYRAVAKLPSSCDNIIGDVPHPGFLGRLSGAETTWLERVAAPSADLALVGTVAWLLKDLSALLGNGADVDGGGTPLSNYVLPRGPKVASWSTSLISSARMREENPIPQECAAVVLDRYGAIKYLDEITVPVVICVIDRSVADDSAAEQVIQARVSGSQPLSITEELRWSPPAGVEAMAFTVSL